MGKISSILHRSKAGVTFQKPSKTGLDKAFRPACSDRGLKNKPHKNCPECGNPLEFVYINGSTTLNAFSLKKPTWIELPCNYCEQKAIQLKETQNRISALLKNSMLKKRFVTKTFANFEIYSRKSPKKQTEVYEIAKDFAQNFSHHLQLGTWLLFSGSVGTGKSHLSAAVINEVVKQGHTCLYTKMHRLLREVKDTFNKNSHVTQNEVISHLENVDLLIIDEIGVQFGTDTERMIIYDILDARYENVKPIILTTNVTNLKVLEKLLGEKIIDRLYEKESRIITFHWESYRRLQTSQ